jgi:hypothetical protein
MDNAKIAAAVALALGSVTAAHAATPTTAQCAASTTVPLYVAGSSAVQKALFAGLAAGPFAANGPPAYYKGSNGNFQVLCGFDASSNLVAVHYRAEGGSVVGALPLVPPQHKINFLSIGGCPAAVAYPANATCATTGTSATVGTSDGWGGNVTQQFVDVGITDIEPAQFTAANYPSAYSPAVFGSATGAQFGALVTTPLVDQVFGIFVNTSGFNGGGATGQAVSLTREAVANLLDGTYTDWSQVPTVSNAGVAGVVSTSAAAVTLVNREAGSGTRTEASIYFLDYNCGQTTRAIAEGNPLTDSFATSDALAAAAKVPGAFTYASIDNDVSANLTLASLQGTFPTNLAATSGLYDDWYEARLIRATNTTPAAPALAIYNFLRDTMPTVASAPKVKDILATPNAGVPANATAVPVVGVGAPAIYINPYGRAGSSCHEPSKK